MRVLLAFTLLMLGMPALADDYQRLYQAAGWPEQRAHFNDALHAAQKRYQANLRQHGFSPITTEIRDNPPFYYAEGYHQQYLAKNPNGYCGIGGTGVTCS